MLTLGVAELDNATEADGVALRLLVAEDVEDSLALRVAVTLLVGVVLVVPVALAVGVTDGVGDTYGTAAMERNATGP